EEIMISRALPDEMPGVILIDAKQTATLAVRGLEGAGVGPGGIPLAKRQPISVLAGLGRHETDAESPTVHRVAESLNRQRFTLRALELPGQFGVHERILSGRLGDGDGDFHEVIGFHTISRL